jgi:hypothetical protein
LKPFESATADYDKLHGLLLLHGVLQRSPPGVVDVWKDEWAFGDTRCVQIDATRGQAADGYDVAPARGPDERSMRVIPEIFGRRHENPAGRTDDGGEQ